jgi:hypothetical protein
LFLASDYGGVFYTLVSSLLSLQDCLLNENTGIYGGGAVFLESSSSVVNTSRFSNHDGTAGAVMHLVGSDIVISTTVFENNGVTAFQGGVFYLSVHTHLTLINSNFSYNKVCFDLIVLLIFFFFFNRII